MLTETLRETFASLLPTGVTGTLVYTREMPRRLLKHLVADPSFAIPYWEVYGVVRDPVSDREVSADEAAVGLGVERRELISRLISPQDAIRKRDGLDSIQQGEPNLLLLVDPDDPGAGIDGIYNSGTPLTQLQLVREATSLVRRRDEDLRQFVDDALTAERKRAQRRTPRDQWHHLEFMCAVAEDHASAGRMLVRLDLWPVRSASGSFPSAADVDNAETIAYEMFNIEKARTSAHARVAWLRLPDQQASQGRDLVQLLDRYAARPAKDALKEVESTQVLWLGAISPRVFTEPTPLSRISLQSWRTANGQSALPWSGLKVVGGQLSLGLPKELGSGHLAVRWKITPTNVPEGSITYRVDVRAGVETIATHLVPHKRGLTQSVRFAASDFDDILEGDVLACEVVVSVEGDGAPFVMGGADPADQTIDQPVSETARRAVSETFLLTLGDAVDPDPREGAGTLFPSMALAVTSLDGVDRPTFEALAQAGQIDGVPAFGIDKQGNATFRFRTRGVRAAAPRALYDLARRWSVGHKGAPGRWQLHIRADGSPTVASLDDAEFVKIGSNHREFDRSSVAFADWASRAGGPVGALYHLDNTPAVKDYVDNYWSAMRSGPPDLALVQTIEVVSISGRTIGLIVLPTHPLRVAWQQAFDMLVCHLRFEEGVPHKELRKLLVEACAGTQCPAMLPGPNGVRPFVFGNAIGFHAMGLVVEGDPEPKATLSLLRRALTGSGAEEPTESETTVGGIASQVKKYLDLNRAYTRVRVHGLRAGDGATLSRALGKAVARRRDEENSDGDGREQGDIEVAVELNLHPASDDRADLTGRHLSLTAERSRKGAGVVPPPDRWIMGSATRPGGREVPQLTWTRSKTKIPDTDAHLAVMFDIFKNRIETRSLSDAPTASLEMYGLFIAPLRVFTNDGTPRWVGYFPPKPSGAMHPADDLLTRRVLQLHGAMLSAVARSLGQAEDQMPVSVTEVSDDERAALEQVHMRVDWAITADRNAGIEFFDSPDARDEELSRQHATYVIDAVPERSDLGTVQLVTSTSRTDQLQRLLAQALGTMNLPEDKRNLTDLLRSLKQISGRLTMRLARGGTVARELAALAYMQRSCTMSLERVGDFPSLKSGFFVPLDDVNDLFGLAGETSDDFGVQASSGMRTDLLHVTAGRRGSLSLTFVEVKYRRSLIAARGAQTLHEIDAQLRASRTRWELLFGAQSSILRRAISRMRLARILTFYSQKGQRYGMSEISAGYVKREIEKLAFSDGGLPDPPDIRTAGYVFCPEYIPTTPDRLLGDQSYWIFGPGVPLSRIAADQENNQSEDDAAADVQPRPAPTQDSPQVLPAVHDPNASDTPDASSSQDAAEHTPKPVAAVTGADNSAPPALPSSGGTAAREESGAKETLSSEGSQSSDANGVVLGYIEGGDTPAIWRQDIRTNPHLMILGLPGMGKTSALLNICEQLIAQGITPIVFSYHEDIDDKLASSSPVQPRYVTYERLGFNPMRVSSDSAFAHVDSVGNLRDIFSAVFPDLGDIQLGKLREAILKSYTDRGWARGVQGQTPPFSAFYETLKSDPRPDKGLNIRLTELADYGLFERDDGTSSLLDSREPVVIQIHRSPNEALQRGIATFILYSLYQGMFRRGLKDRITHAIIFDEAHRASKLKLIPTMAKECRKYGISFILASQQAKDFNDSVFTAIANYLALRVNEDDAKLLARQFADATQVRAYADRIKAMPRYHAYYFGEQAGRPMRAKLIQGMSEISTRPR